MRDMQHVRGAGRVRVVRVGSNLRVVTNIRLAQNVQPFVP